jgi:hypothetical protein
MQFINSRRVFEILSTEVDALTAPEEIEDLIIAISSFDKKQEFLRRLKKKRIDVIEAEINKVEANKAKLKSIILATLNKENVNSLAFPGVGKVFKRKISGSWKVEDEEAVISALSSLDKKEIENVLLFKPKLDKRELNKFLDKRLESGKVTLPGVSKTEDGSSVTISIDDDIQKSYEEDFSVIQSVVNTADLDTLEV